MELVVPPFRDFWTVCNRVAHGEHLDVPDSMLLTLISLGLQFLDAVSARPAAA